MTIDERLEKLTERHEALAGSVELLVAAQVQTEARLVRLEESVDKTVKAIEPMARAIAMLAMISENHEKRLNGLEGRQ